MQIKQKMFVLCMSITLAIGLGSCVDSDLENKDAETMHAVTFLDPNGFEVHAVSVEHNNQVAAADFATARAAVELTLDEGFEFARWDLGTSLSIVADTSFRAERAIKTFVVSYVDSDYTGIFATRVVPFGSEIPNISGPAAVGSQVFLGWQTLVNSVTEDITVYPRMSGTSKFSHDSGLNFYVRSDGLVVAGRVDSYSWPNATYKTIPETINGVPVVAIAVRAFQSLSWSQTVDLVLPSTIRSIGAYAFNSLNIYSSSVKLVLNDGLREIREHAFDYAKPNFASLPDTIEHLGTHAFYNTTGTKPFTISLPNLVDIPPYCFSYSDLGNRFSFSDKTLTIGQYAFSDLRSSDNLVDLSATKIKVIPTATFYGGSGALSRVIFEDILLSNTVEKFEYRAFYYAFVKNAPMIYRTPSSLKDIGDYTFQGTPSFIGIELNDGLERIGNWTFDDCTNVAADLVIPDSVTYIGDSAFTGLGSNVGGGYSLTLGAGCTTIRNATFNAARCFEEVYIHPNVITIADQAFRNLIYAHTLDFGGVDTSLNSIGANAFTSFGSALASTAILITLPSNITVIGSRGFNPNINTSTSAAREVDVTNVSSSLVAAWGDPAVWGAIFGGSESTEGVWTMLS